MAGLVQKNAEFKLFAKHLYKNVRCVFAEVELAIINASNYHKEIKRLKQRFKLPSKHYARDIIYFSSADNQKYFSKKLEKDSFESVRAVSTPFFLPLPIPQENAVQQASQVTQTRVRHLPEVSKLGV